MMMQRRQTKGFTLIELMIAIAIVGILAAIAVPTYNSYTERAKRAEAAQELLSIKSVEEEYFNDYRQYLYNETTLENFYDITITGNHYSINVSNDGSGGFEAQAYVCYDIAGSACAAGNADYTWEITDDTDDPYPI